jgi:hypothetical protein
MDSVLGAASTTRWMRCGSGSCGRKVLFNGLAPETPLQRVAFEQVVCCCWRCKLAARVEARMLKSHFTDPERDSAPEMVMAENPIMRQWYGTNRQTLRDGIRFLSELERDIQSSGHLRDEWSDGLTKGWGPGFLEDLTAWTPMKRDAVLLAHHLVTHAETFNMPLPMNLGELDKTVVIDPQQGEQMVLKLVRQELRHLEDIKRISEQRSDLASNIQNAQVSDFSPRYFTTAMRDLHRAVQWFRYLKKNRL